MTAYAQPPSTLEGGYGFDGARTPRPRSGIGFDGAGTPRPLSGIGFCGITTSEAVSRCPLGPEG